MAKYTPYRIKIIVYFEVIRPLKHLYCVEPCD